MTESHLTTISIVVPVFNEEQALREFHLSLCRIVDSMTYDFQIIYIDDGSTDATTDILNQLASQDNRLAVIELSRNFGHQAALSAGLETAIGDVVICMDGDGQHPPELLPQMIELYEHGYDLVFGQRIDTSQPSRFKKMTSSLFYWLINLLSDTRIEPGVADFRLMTRQVTEALNSMPEYHRFLRGMAAWVGFRSVIIPYVPSERLGGRSKYSLKKMVNLAFDAIFSFSLIPLQIAVGIGILFFLLAFLEAIYVLNFWVRGLQNTLEPGWSSLMFVILIVGGMIMVNLGFLGIYIGYIFQEVKRRPVYIRRIDRGHSPNNSVSADSTSLDSAHHESSESPSVS